MRSFIAAGLAFGASLLSTGSAAALQHEKRQGNAGGQTGNAVNQTLGDLAGVLGSNATFDYVIIGAGTAGLVMAERLSENPLLQVAVIEAGTFYEITNPLLAATPAGDVVFCGASITDTNPAVDWDFVTTAQTGANNRLIHYARGKCLGGSSARNFMIYQRGTVGSYQQWADQIADQSYTFNNLLPYFKKSVNFTPPNTAKRAANATALYNPAAFSAVGGPMHVSYPNYAQSFDSYLQPAFNQIGLPTAADFNSGTLHGIQYCSSTIDPTNEARASSQETFLNAAAGRSNLKVYQLSMAKQILFNSNKQATGVLVEASGVAPFVLSARKEVIVSAGAFQSPQMLMVSGIGPAATLTANGIPILVNNPNVGQHMRDHVFAGPTYRVNLETFTKLANDPAYVATQYAGPYTVNQTGPLTNPVADMLGWEKTPAQYRAAFSPSTLADLATLPADWPEIEYISGAGYVGQFDDLLLSQPKDGYQYATVLSTIVAPFSRGNVTIVSSDTNVLPVINPNWLTSTTDQQVAVAAFKRARDAFASSALQKVVIGDEYFPGKSVSTHAQILANNQNTLLTVWHASCTCAMGKAGATGPDYGGAVVDPKARVYGVSGVRVVDASSFAILPPGHPQSTIYMLAEKIAADILSGN